MEEIKQRIKEHEGFRDTVYSDSLGFATIGYGHLVLPNDPYVEGVTYSKDDLEKVFDNDFKIAEKSANELLTEIKHNHIIKGTYKLNVRDRSFKIEKRSDTNQKSNNNNES